MADSRRAFEIFGWGMAQELDLSHVVPIEEGNFDFLVLDFGVSQPDLVAFDHQGQFIVFHCSLTFGIGVINNTIRSLLGCCSIIIYNTNVYLAPKSYYLVI